MTEHPVMTLKSRIIDGIVHTHIEMKGDPTYDEVTRMLMELVRELFSVIA